MANVRKVMSTEVLTLKKEARIDDSAKLLSRADSGCVVILDNNKPVGILTELDFIRNVALKKRSLKEPISKIMTIPITHMTSDMNLDEALKIIDSKGFRRYPVVDNDKLVGLVTSSDVINYMSDNIRFHRNMQNVVLILFVLFEFFVFVLSKYSYKLPL